MLIGWRVLIQLQYTFVQSDKILITRFSDVIVSINYAKYFWDFQRNKVFTHIGLFFFSFSWWNFLLISVYQKCLTVTLYIENRTHMVL